MNRSTTASSRQCNVRMDEMHKKTKKQCMKRTHEKRVKKSKTVVKTRAYYHTLYKKLKRIMNKLQVFIFLKKNIQNMYKNSECPLTMEPIESCKDVFTRFVYRKTNRKMSIFRFDACALSQYFRESGNFQCPFTREPFLKHDLQRLHNISNLYTDKDVDFDGENIKGVDHFVEWVRQKALRHKITQSLIQILEEDISNNVQHVIDSSDKDNNASIYNPQFSREVTTILVEISTKIHQIVRYKDKEYALTYLEDEMERCDRALKTGRYHITMIKYVRNCIFQMHKHIVKNTTDYFQMIAGVQPFMLHTTESIHVLTAAQQIHSQSESQAISQADPITTDDDRDVAVRGIVLTVQTM